jgi:prolyl-tRNA synthetase
LIAADVRSYKQLPKNIYQIQTKFRDEPRPRFGLIRVKEFLMKDAYSFDADDAGADQSYRAMYAAYKKIFARCGLKTIEVEAYSGAMGGSHSHEFMVVSPAGEDQVVLCEKCDYAANLEKAVSRVEVRSQKSGVTTLEKFPTPGVRTIEDLTKPPYNVAAENQIKTLVYVLDDKLTLVLLRGSDELNEAKLPAATARPAHAEEIKAALGASAGSVGAVGVKNLAALVDETLRGATGMVTGANLDDVHLRGLDIARDINVMRWLDLRAIKSGEGCPKCDGVVRVEPAIELGHVFMLGTKYSVAFGANYLDETGANKPMVMGSYGIGVSRCVAAVVEQCHDEKGICWPRSVAPYQVAILALNVNDANTTRVAEEIYNELNAAGIEAILDDRVDRPGVKFNDADLVGFPLRVTVGEKSLAKGGVELKARAEAESSLVPAREAVSAIRAKLVSLP